MKWWYRLRTRCAGRFMFHHWHCTGAEARPTVGSTCEHEDGKHYCVIVYECCRCKRKRETDFG